MFEAFVRMFRHQPTAKIEALARQVVEASLDEVARLVAGRVGKMSLSEARGYVRARSAAIVRRETRIAVARHPQALADWSASIIPAATERLIPQVLRHTNAGVTRRVAPPLAA